jgi:hypothetical protein
VLNKKIGNVWATIIVCIIIGGGLFCWFYYYWALEDQKKDWYKTEYIEKEFKGTIKEIGEYKYNSDFHFEFISLTITITDTLNSEVHYGMLSFKKEPLLKTFISLGDSVLKIKGNKEITFKKLTGQTKSFQLPIDIEE